MNKRVEYWITQPVEGATIRIPEWMVEGRPAERKYTTIDNPCKDKKQNHDTTHSDAPVHL